jgi:hypothetical protein
LAATKIFDESSIYPTARSNNSISRKNKVRKRTQELRMAAIVKMTVRMNQAQQYMPRALLKSGLIAPVVGSVYAKFLVSRVQIMMKI